MKRIIFALVPALFIFTFGAGQTKTNNQSIASNAAQKQQFTEGKDYLVYKRVRLMDKTGFAQPQEAYSLLLPKDWNSHGDVIWISPGQTCAGTYRKLRATSGDGKYTFEMLPEVLYSWNPEMAQYQNNDRNSLCRTGQPMNAETYLRQLFARELGAQVISVEANAAVVKQMQQGNEKARNELMQYGASDVQFDQTALNATLKLNDGTEAMVTLGSTIMRTTIPNAYTGSYSQSYTTQISKRTIFKYPSSAKEQAKHLYGMIMSSFRTNPAWNDAVNGFWRQARQQSHTAHVGRIAMMDAETKRIGEQAVRNGQDRLKAMDTQMRSWESSQASQDRMHTEFIKTIREVENYQDASTGNKFEMSSGYNHAWSRGDGTSFILSNNPNFNPASVLQDQHWKEMRKVR
ncbi:MAG: hypothetical protein WCF67_17880 [Chitinophagaceae bacterium]